MIRFLDNSMPGYSSSLQGKLQKNVYLFMLTDSVIGSILGKHCMAVRAANFSEGSTSLKGHYSPKVHKSKGSPCLYKYVGPTWLMHIGRILERNPIRQYVVELLCDANRLLSLR